MKTTAELLTLINTNIADNTTGAITHAKVREVTTSSNGWVIAPSALAVITRIEGII